MCIPVFIGNSVVVVSTFGCVNWIGLTSVDVSTTELEAGIIFTAPNVTLGASLTLALVDDGAESLLLVVEVNAFVTSVTLGCGNANVDVAGVGGITSMVGGGAVLFLFPSITSTDCCSTGF